MTEHSCNYSQRDTAWQWDGKLHGPSAAKQVLEIARLLDTQPDPARYRAFRRSMRSGPLTLEEAHDIARHFLGRYPIPREPGCAWGDQGLGIPLAHLRGLESTGLRAYAAALPTGLVRVI